MRHAVASLALVSASVSALASALSPRVVHAQGRAADRQPCSIDIRGVRRGSDTTRVRMFRGPTGTRITYIGGGVDATCEGQGNRLLADSAEHYEDRGMLILFHNVRYTEPRVRLTSDKMTYYTVDERLLAEGNVNGTTPSGTRFVGPKMEYFRAKPGLRTASRMIATGRPFVRMSPEERRSGAPRAPRRDPKGATLSDSVDLHADQVISENDSLVWAWGKVIIERHDVRATADSAFMDQGKEFARLMKQPVVVGRGERSFTLDGITLDLWSTEGDLTRVRADGNAKVVSDSLTLTADTVDLRLKTQRMERVFAWAGGATAETPSSRIDADSLDIHMPSQRLREVRALGHAKATSTADTAKIVTDERDWIAGDTLVALFDTTVVADSTQQPKMTQVVATGSARSFYQMAPSDSAKGKPSISYNRGRVITVAFKEGEVSTVDVIEGATGIYLDPLKAPADAAPATPPPAGRRPAPPAPRGRP